MKQNIAISIVIGLGLMACAPRTVGTAPAVYRNFDSSTQVQAPPTPAAKPASVIFNYEQQSWPQSAPTHDWKGYVPTGYHPPPNNAFDAGPVYGGAYSVPYAGGYCAPGAGLSVGFGFGGCSVGVEPCGSSAGVGLGCYPIGVGFGAGCY